MKMDPRTGEWKEEQSSFQPSFTHQRQPSPYSCLPTSFAMVMSQDVKDIIQEIGHDDERGFHVQELLSYALKQDWIFSPFEINPEVEPPFCCKIEGCEKCGGNGWWPLKPKVKSIKTLLSQYNGILTGQALPRHDWHAVAWCHKTQKCIDPRGAVYSLDGFNPDCFWLAVKL